MFKLFVLVFAVVLISTGVTAFKGIRLSSGRLDNAAQKYRMKSLNAFDLDSLLIAAQTTVKADDYQYGAVNAPGEYFVIFVRRHKAPKP